jgi:hypothetical protein
VYRTIVKNLHHIKVLKNKKRAKESRKGSLKASEEKHLKSASEDKSASEER